MSNEKTTYRLEFHEGQQNFHLCDTINPLALKCGWVLCTESISEKQFLKLEASLNRSNENKLTVELIKQRIKELER